MIILRRPPHFHAETGHREKLNEPHSSLGHPFPLKCLANTDRLNYVRTSLCVHTTHAEYLNALMRFAQKWRVYTALQPAWKCCYIWPVRKRIHNELLLAKSVTFRVSESQLARTLTVFLEVLVVCCPLSVSLHGVGLDATFPPPPTPFRRKVYKDCSY